MKINSITATEANRSFSRMLRAVERGERFAITSHGKEIAVLQPVSDDDAKRRRRTSLAAHLEALNQRQFVNGGPWSREDLYARG